MSLIHRGMSISGPMIDGQTEGDKPVVAIQRATISLTTTQDTATGPIKEGGMGMLPFTLEIDGMDGEINNVKGAIQITHDDVEEWGWTDSNRQQMRAQGKGVWRTKAKLDGGAVDDVPCVWMLDAWPGAGRSGNWRATMLVTFDNGEMFVLWAGAHPELIKYPSLVATVRVWDDGTA